MVTMLKNKCTIWKNNANNVVTLLFNLQLVCEVTTHETLLSHSFVKCKDYHNLGNIRLIIDGLKLTSQCQVWKHAIETDMQAKTYNPLVLYVCS
jgi:hypothetical protein